MPQAVAMNIPGASALEHKLEKLELRNVSSTRASNRIIPPSEWTTGYKHIWEGPREEREAKYLLPMKSEPPTPTKAPDNLFKQM